MGAETIATREINKSLGDKDQMAQCCVTGTVLEFQV